VTETNAPKPNAYDEFDYPGFSFINTHPDQLAVMAALHGLSPAPVESCRVLEIACGEGANLIPMAHAFPRAEFTGFDLAGVPIRRGQQRARALGLRNLRLFQADLMEVGPEQDRGALGQYDYIIAHGLYAWVPEPVRDALLALCSRHLAPAGVAFVSYNAWPGSYLRNIFRDLIRRAAGPGEPTEEQIAEGLNLLEALLHARGEDDPWRRVFDEQLLKMRRRANNTTRHDELAPTYNPVWFSAFVGHAASHGLEHLGDAELPVLSDPCFRPDLVARVRSIAGDDPVRQEEILDFSRMCPYRESLLTPAGQTIRPELDAQALHTLRIASPAVSADGERPGQRFYGIQSGYRLALDQAPAIAVMERLIAIWPRTLSFDEAHAVMSQAGLPSDADAARLLLQMAIARIVELHSWQPDVANRVSERPQVAAICRHEVTLHPYTANLWHGTVQLDEPVVRKLLLLADGTRTREQMLAALVHEFPAIPKTELETGVEENLDRFRRAALLVA
jgi:SAM-dependent methyltransferase